MSRRCPHCGVEVPTFSVTCPSCYRSIPRGERRAQEEDVRGPAHDAGALSERRVSRRAVAVLALLPAAFGVMGLGQIYQRDYAKGFAFMLAGASLMLAIASLASRLGPSIGWNVLIAAALAGCGVLFAGLYLVQAFDAIVRSLFVWRR